MEDLGDLGRLVSLTYAAAVNEALVAAQRRAPTTSTRSPPTGRRFSTLRPNTIQWFDPALVAALVGCPVISDFRRADCAAGGQGAPLVPFADYILFRHPTMDRAVVNIGGIANITCLFGNCTIDQVLAWDTGPGNCISDYLMREHFPEGSGVDVGGRLALRGTPDRELSRLLHDNPYFVKLNAKSTDGPSMIRLYASCLTRTGRTIRLEDQLATACHLTAFQIVRATHVFGGQFLGELIVSGGGIENQAIVKFLRHWLGSKAPIRPTDELGVPSQAKEALAFALLGAATLDNIPSNVLGAAGARKRVILGSITPRP